MKLAEIPPRTYAGAAVATCTMVVIASVATSGPPRFVREYAGLNVMIQTTAGLVALLVGTLAFGRYRVRGRLGDLLVVFGLALLAVVDLAFTAVPLALASGTPSSTAIWAGVLGALVATCLLAAGAWLREDAIEPSPHAGRDELTVLGVTAFLSALVVAIASRAGAVPAAALAPSPDRLIAIPGATWLGLVLFATATALLLAAAGFLRGVEREPGDELRVWLAIGCLLAAAGRVVTALSFESTYSPYVSSGDLLRLGFHLLLLAGVVREIRGYWRARAEGAVLEERRRIAQELHDGMAQELAYVAAHARALSSRAPDRHLDAICASAERALDESRRAIAALTRPVHEPLDVALAQTAEEVASRVGARVSLELQAGIDIPPMAREALLRIAREAITNAGRHGRASRIHVRLAAGNGIRMRISDNGVGFEPETLDANPGKLGITGMRERAEALGGRFLLASRPYGGTDVEILLP